MQLYSILFLSPPQGGMMVGDQQFGSLVQDLNVQETCFLQEKCLFCHNKPSVVPPLLNRKAKSR